MLKKKRPVEHLRNEKFLVGVIRNELKPVFLSDSQRKRISRIAREHGINPETHCYYPQLASYYGDPTAFVSTKQELRKRIKEKNLKIVDEA